MLRARDVEHIFDEGAAIVPDPIAEVTSLLDALDDKSPLAKVEESLRSLALALNGADPLRRATVREAAKKKLENIGISAPARLLDAALGNGGDKTEEQQGRPVMFDDPEPWPEAVGGAALLDDLVTILERFVILPQRVAEAVALWVLHVHALEAFSVSPILAIISATKRSGKTLLLELLSLLVPRRLFASSITAAALFRAVDKFKPCLLIDEADTFLRDSDELRGILNASHRRASAFVVRTVGDEHEPAFFVTWSAKAVAMIGKLPGTLEDRSIVISMKRKAPGEQVERFRADRAGLELQDLKRRALRWAADNLDALRKADAEAPGTLNDRAADNWRPLLAIADLAGGEWPERARAAAKALSQGVDEAESSPLIELLVEIREIFESTDRISSAELVECLGAKAESRWAEWSHGKPITQRQIARLLSPLKIKSGSIRIGNETAKGYVHEAFDDAFSRYTPVAIRHTVTNEQIREVMLKIDPSQVANVTDRKGEVTTRNFRDVTDVTDRKPLQGEIWEDDL